jgi:hypothetical protein
MASPSLLGLFLDKCRAAAPIAAVSERRFLLRFFARANPSLLPASSCRRLSTSSISSPLCIFGRGDCSFALTMIVPFAAGGSTDTLARIIAERMRTTLGQTIIIENAGGAAGSIAVGRVVRAASDGYTLSIGHWGTHVVNGATYSLRYDLLKDLAPMRFSPLRHPLSSRRMRCPRRTFSN